MKTHFSRFKHILTVGSSFSTSALPSQAQWVCEDYLPLGRTSYEITQLPDGSLVTAAYELRENGSPGWIVRQKEGGMWQTIDQFQLEDGYYFSKAEAVAADHAGNVYVAGLAGDTAKGNHTCLRFIDRRRHGINYHRHGPTNACV